MHCRAFGKPLCVNHSTDLLRFLRQNYVILSQLLYIYIFLETTSGLLLGPSGVWTLDYGTPSYRAIWAAYHKMSDVWPNKHHFIHKWEWYVRGQAQAGPEDIRNCISKWHGFLWNPLLLHCLFSLSRHLWPHGVFFMISWLRIENNALGLQIFLPEMLAEVEIERLQHNSPT